MVKAVSAVARGAKASYVRVCAWEGAVVEMVGHGAVVGGRM